MNDEQREKKMTGLLSRLFKQMKLGEYLFKNEIKISKELTTNCRVSAAEIEAKIMHDMALDLSKKVIENHERFIDKKSDVNYDTYTIEMLTLPMQDFKTIVEACIITLDEQQIKMIRNSESL